MILTVLIATWVVIGLGVWVGNDGDEDSNKVLTLLFSQVLWPGILLFWGVQKFVRYLLAD